MNWPKQFPLLPKATALPLISTEIDYLFLVGTEEGKILQGEVALGRCQLLTGPLDLGGCHSQQTIFGWI